MDENEEPTSCYRCWSAGVPCPADHEHRDTDEGHTRGERRRAWLGG